MLRVVLVVLQRAEQRQCRQDNMNIIPIYYLCCTGICSAWSHPFVECSLFSCNLALLIMTVGCKISGIWSLISFLFKRNIITINAIWRCIQYSALVLRTALQQTCRQCFMMFNIITYNQACLCLKLGGFAVNHHQSVAVVSKDTIYVKIFLIQLSQFQAHSPNIVQHHDCETSITCLVENSSPARWSVYRQQW